MHIPISKTILSKKDITEVTKCLKSGWLVQGPKVKELEIQWSNFTKAKFSLAVTSCTTAMYLCLKALGFQKGDEAIVPAFTWISTANVVEQLGGKVIFCDIDLNSFNLNVSEMRVLSALHSSAGEVDKMWNVGDEKFKNIPRIDTGYPLKGARCVNEILEVVSAPTHSFKFSKI